MTLEQYIDVMNITDPIEQLRKLGYIQKMNIGEAKKLIDKELSIDYEPKKIQKLKISGRKFKLLYDIEDLDLDEYPLFKQIVGDAYANDVDSEDVEIVINDDIKYQKIIKNSHKILAIFLKEMTLFKKRKLNYYERCELFKQLDAQTVINILFFYSNVINNLLRNGLIYYMQRMDQIQKRLLEQD